MPTRTKRYIFFVIWFLVILSGPVTVLRNTSFDSLSNPIVLVNTFQRITGLLAFTILSIQIVLGSYMNRWVQVIGARAYKLHITEGLVAYGFMFIHPLFENIIVYQVSRSLTDALLVFVPSFGTQRDILLVFGRSAFILATIAVTAGYFRTKPFFRRNWRAFHILNYLVFFLVWVHARLGTDITTPPFVWIYRASFILISATLIYRFALPLLKKIVPIPTKEAKEKA